MMLSPASSTSRRSSCGAGDIDINPLRCVAARQLAGFPPFLAVDDHGKTHRPQRGHIGSRPGLETAVLAVEAIHDFAVRVGADSAAVPLTTDRERLVPHTAILLQSAPALDNAKRLQRIEEHAINLLHLC